MQHTILKTATLSGTGLHSGAVITFVGHHFDPLEFQIGLGFQGHIGQLLARLFVKITL